MSRIIIERHANGEEKLTAGYDRPLGYFFVDTYDDEGEFVEAESIGLLGHRGCGSPYDAQGFLLRRHGVDHEVAEQVADLLTEHKTLEYPASNVVVDLTREAQ